MNKYLKWSLIIIPSLALLLFIAFQGFMMYTKSHSPQETVNYNDGSTLISIAYSRPFKKGREIYGGLVPFDKVWRTGANECTIFTTSVDLTIDGKTLPAGKYSIFTIPGSNSWKVIWNKNEYDWGVTDREGTSPRIAEADAVVVSMPPVFLPEVVEQFTISVDQVKGLTLAWDHTEVSVPLGL